MKQTARKLFFALWPPREVAEAIGSQARACGVDGRAVVSEKLHLTLAFLGGVPESAQAGLRAAAAEIALPAFDLTLARLGHFRGSGVAWIGPAVTPPALLDLAAALRDAAAAVGIGTEKRRFRAHLTVARRAAPPRRARLHEPLRWPVSAFVLTQSVQVGGRVEYRHVERWPLVPVSME